MQLTYNNQTPLAGGCFEPKDSGVSRFGKVVIEEMNRLGMIVDLSHAGKQTCLDVIHHSSQPVAISHANPNFFHQSLRNIDDDVLIELAKKNGFIGLSLYPYHLKNQGKCTIEDFCSMIKQLINLIGIEHIGIGSDLCNNWPDEVVMWMRNGKWTKKIDYGESTSKNTSWPEQPAWFEKGSDIINIFNGLVKSGMNENDAFKILGSNWLEFMKGHF
jgi:microsomal dipeptidase-like Zn-dependent dipeptidase